MSLHRWLLKFRTNLRVVICLSLLFTNFYASPGTAEPSDEVREGNPIAFAGIALGCMAVGVPTCILLSQNEETDLSIERTSKKIGGQFGYFPSYVLDFAESKAFQRIETSVYVGNVMLALNHRRGVQEPNHFSSTSYRIAYSFDWRHLQPAIGFGARKNVNARNGDCFEIWLPVFFKRGILNDDDFYMFFETLWVIGPIGIRPELQARFEYEVASHLSLAFGFGYFADYDNPEAEVSIGPIMTF